MKGTLRKVGSSSLPWEARWWEDGRQRKRRFRTEKAGHKALLDANIRDERRKLGMPADPGPITYAELVQRYLDQYDRRSKRWLEEMLSYSLAGFGDIRVRSLASDRDRSVAHSPPGRQQDEAARAECGSAGSRDGSGVGVSGRQSSASPSREWPSVRSPDDHALHIA